MIAVQLVSAEQLNIVHDSNGNTISGDGFYREYNEFNQLVKIRNGTASSPILEEYIYHPTEERVLIKDVFRNGAVFETVYYINDEFVRVVNLTGTYDTVYVKVDGQLVAQKNNDGTKQFVHADHLGSASVVTDESGNAIENTSYSPFGEILTGGSKSRYSYTEQEFDSVIGDYDFDARRYCSKWGIFCQPDTLLPNVYDPQQLNRYSFERNNPYKYVDTSGHITFWASLLLLLFISAVVGVLTTLINLHIPPLFPILEEKPPKSEPPTSEGQQAETEEDNEKEEETMTRQKTKKAVYMDEDGNEISIFVPVTAKDIQINQGGGSKTYAVLVGYKEDGTPVYGAPGTTYTPDDNKKNDPNAHNGKSDKSKTGSGTGSGDGRGSSSSSSDKYHFCRAYGTAKCGSG